MQLSDNADKSSHRNRQRRRECIDSRCTLAQLGYIVPFMMDVLDGRMVRVYRHFKHANSGYIMPEDV